MKWRLEDIPFLLTQLPHALYDVLQHEDKELVKRVKLQMALAPAVKMDVSEQGTGDASEVSVEKVPDPLVFRSMQNVSLLVYDYIHQLPGAESSHEEGVQLINHWRTLVMHQPERIASAPNSHFHDERCKNFLQEILEHKYGKALPEGTLDAAWEDWRRASSAGSGINPQERRKKMQNRQWQDLVTRMRLHYLAMKLSTDVTPPDVVDL